MKKSEKQRDVRDIIDERESHNWAVLNHKNRLRKPI